MDRRVVITGLGIVAPKSNNVAEFWTNINDGKIGIDHIDKCDTNGLSIQLGGQVKDIHPELVANKRLIRKCDDFSVYSLLASQEALVDAKIDLKEIDPDKFGIYVGNNSGGWYNAHKALTDLHSKGVDSLSPYLASNWFPAAVQGHLSIHHNIKGYSKTINADMASSNISIGNAYQLIKNGQADYMLAGGAETLMVTWGLIFYETTSILNSREDDPQKAYQPFGVNRDGMVLAEGAAYLVLETYETAIARNAYIYGEITGYALTNDGVGSINVDDNGTQYARAIQLAVGDNEIPNYISLSGTATKEGDDSEINGLNHAFGDKIDQITCSCPKAFWGNSYGAAGAMDAVTACLSMKNNKVIKTGNVVEVADNVNFNLVTKENVNMNINSSLILSKGLGGINSALYIKKIN